MSLKYEIIREGVTLRHYRHAEFHRIDRPASIWLSSSLYWYEFGISHRSDGPSDVTFSGYNEYYFRGTKYSKEEYESKIRSYQK